MKFDRQLRPATATSWVVSYDGKTIPRWRTAAILKIDISPYHGTLLLVYLKMQSNCLYLRQCTVISSAKLNHVTLVLTGNVLPPNAIFGKKTYEASLWHRVTWEISHLCLQMATVTCEYSQTRVEEDLISADSVGAFYRYVNRRITSNSSVGVIADHSVSKSK